MNKEQQELLDEVYENFAKSYTGSDGVITLPPDDYITDDGDLIPKEEFINKIKTDDEFSEKWGLKIEERELSLVDRYQIMKTSDLNDWLNIHCKEPKTMEYMDKNDIPIKLITITYNDKTIESYE